MCQEAEPFVHFQCLFVGHDKIALVGKFGDCVSNRVIEAAVKGSKFVDGKLRVTLKRQSGDGLAQIAVIMDHFINAETKDKKFTTMQRCRHTYVLQAWINSASQAGNFTPCIGVFRLLGTQRANQLVKKHRHTVGQLPVGGSPQGALRHLGLAPCDQFVAVTRKKAVQEDLHGRGHKKVGEANESCFGGTEATIVAVVRDQCAVPHLRSISSTPRPVSRDLPAPQLPINRCPADSERACRLGDVTACIDHCFADECSLDVAQTRPMGARTDRVRAGVHRHQAVGALLAATQWPHSHTKARPEWHLYRIAAARGIEEHVQRQREEVIAVQCRNLSQQRLMQHLPCCGVGAGNSAFGIYAQQAFARFVFHRSGPCQVQQQFARVMPYQRVLYPARLLRRQMTQLGPLGHLHAGEVEHADAVALRPEQRCAGAAVDVGGVEEMFAAMQPHRLVLG